MFRVYKMMGGIMFRVNKKMVGGIDVLEYIRRWWVD